MATHMTETFMSVFVPFFLSLFVSVSKGLVFKISHLRLLHRRPESRSWGRIWMKALSIAWGKYRSCWPPSSTSRRNLKMSQIIERHWDHELKHQPSFSCGIENRRFIFLIDEIFILNAKDGIISIRRNTTKGKEIPKPRLQVRHVWWRFDHRWLW